MGFGALEGLGLCRSRNLSFRTSDAQIGESDAKNELVIFCNIQVPQSGSKWVPVDSPYAPRRRGPPDFGTIQQKINKSNKNTNDFSTNNESISHIANNKNNLIHNSYDSCYQWSSRETRNPASSASFCHPLEVTLRLAYLQVLDRLLQVDNLTHQTRTNAKMHPRMTTRDRERGLREIIPMILVKGDNRNQIS